MRVLSNAACCVEACTLFRPFCECDKFSSVFSSVIKSSKCSHKNTLSLGGTRDDWVRACAPSQVNSVFSFVGT